MHLYGGYAWNFADTRELSRFSCFNETNVSNFKLSSAACINVILRFSICVIRQFPPRQLYSDDTPSVLFVACSSCVTYCLMVHRHVLIGMFLLPHRRGSVLFLLSLILGVGVAGNLLITVQPSTSYTNSTTTMHPGFPLHTTNSTTL